MKAGLLAGAIALGFLCGCGSSTDETGATGTATSSGGAGASAGGAANVGGNGSGIVQGGANNAGGAFSSADASTAGSGVIANAGASDAGTVMAEQDAGSTGGSAGSPNNSDADGGMSSDPCGGCSGLTEICIYQVGGPGPSHYACAVQNPCGAAGACACIVNQGPCQPGTDPETGFNGCFCDNGLD
jgi:hypothetical protein